MGVACTLNWKKKKQVIIGYEKKKKKEKRKKGGKNTCQFNFFNSFICFFKCFEKYQFWSNLLLEKEKLKKSNLKKKRKERNTSNVSSNINWTSEGKSVFESKYLWKYVMKISSFVFTVPLSKHCPHVSSNVQTSLALKKSSGKSSGDTLSGRICSFDFF